MADIFRRRAADDDLLAIGAYGTATWGTDAAIEFVATFDEAFALLAQHPDIGRRRDDVGRGVRSWLHRGHVIYYLHLSNSVVIGRIMHGAADPIAHADFNEGEA